MVEEQKFDVSKMDASEIEQLKEQLKAEEQKTKWLGTHGIRTTFRNIGKAYIYKPNKEMAEDEKKAQLKKDLEQFISERLE